ncbi:MAG: FGGY-family carbohydrate kinase [Planctomycetales bacterium]
MTARHTSSVRSSKPAACGLRWIVQTLRDGGVPVRRFVATGGLPHHSPLFLQICADVLNETIVVPDSKQGPALGAAILVPWPPVPSRCQLCHQGDGPLRILTDCDS